MFQPKVRVHIDSSAAASARLLMLLCAAALPWAVFGQQPEAIPSSAIALQPVAASNSSSMGEEQIKRLLVGKDLFLRGGYLDNSLSFGEHGALIGHSPQGSYTLSGIRIDRVRLTKHKLELDGQRYALHFLGAMPYEDPAKAVDRVKITPKKKIVHITIDRELVVKPKHEKGKNKQATKTAPLSRESSSSEQDEANQVQAEIAAAPEAERPADPKSLTTTTSPAHAAQLLKAAIDNVFSQGFDNRMMAAMPDFWRLYYEAAAQKADYRPKDPAVLRQNMVDKKARLVTAFQPVSNQYAQDNGVAGISLYHVIVGVDGKPGEIAVARPIGFGLDESAVGSIRKAKFESAIKDGKPVPVLLDLVVEFRIYSNLTTGAAKSPVSQPVDQPSAAPSLPGPYSVRH